MTDYELEYIYTGADDTEFNLDDQLDWDEL